MSNSKFTITKNTIPAELRRFGKEHQMRKELAIKRGLEHVREQVAGAGISDFPVVTGRLKGSIHGDAQYKDDSIYKVEKLKDAVIGWIGTRVEYARRIEFGFVGTDKAGRRYNQQGQFPFTKGFKRANEGNKLFNIILNTLRT